MEDLTIFNWFAIAFLIGAFVIFILRLTAFCVKIIKKIEQNEINLKRKK